jgi:hypothetical protein
MNIGLASPAAPVFVKAPVDAAQASDSKVFI